MDTEEHDFVSISVVPVDVRVGAGRQGGRVHRSAGTIVRLIT
jgi:hypothetical protein